MIFSSVSELDKRSNADVLILPFFYDLDVVVSAADLSDDILGSVWEPIGLGDFKAKAGTIELVYNVDLLEHRVLLLGLGKSSDIDSDSIRVAYSKAVEFCHKKGLENINLLLPNLGYEKEVVEGILLRNYSFDELKNKSKEDDIKLIKKVTVIGGSEKFVDELNQCDSLFKGVYLARNLINRCADFVTPHYLSEIAKELSIKHDKVVTTTFDASQINEMGMGLLFAVGKGSANKPTFTIVKYNGDPASDDVTALVGKGITFDAGGLNLKPTGYIEDMRSDMSGAATVLGVIESAANMNLKANIVAVVPAAENSIGPNSYKCGDVYKSYSGKYVEISNTDAEGRLILADALAYTCEVIKPNRIIDIATLTGAIVVALGEEVAGVMGNDQNMIDALKLSGETTYERIWQLPLYKEFRELLKSDIADIKNCGNRTAGSITAGIFLKEFVDDTPWTHLDIAGTAFLDKQNRYYSKNATGWGVRILIDYISNL